jgi:chromosome segregation ATPase
MADRISALEAEKASLESALATSGKPTTAQPTESTTDNPQLRLDLAEALRSKGVMETRLRTAEEELTKLRSRTKGDSKSIRDLASERTMITTRLKDREYELKEKRKLIEVPMRRLRTNPLC